MKRKIIFLLTIILVIISGALIIKNNSNKNYFEIKGAPNLNIMVLHNGSIMDEFPTKDNNLYYNVEVSCDNADAKWDYENWRILVSNLSNTSICNLNFTSSAKTTLYQKIINDWNNGSNTKNIYKEDHTLESGLTYFEYRYEGTDTAVQNYVWFNNELWRIIGAFPGGTPSTMSGTTFVQGNAAPSKNNTVKIIRNDAIGGFAWDKDQTNNWPTAELNTNILNNLYLNSGTGTCNMVYSVAKPCSFSANGLKNVRDYLEDATWNLGGWNDEWIYLVDIYKYERGTTVYSGRPYLTTAKVGLMYPSDYAFATASDSCQSRKRLSNYGDCASEGWLLKFGEEWTQTVNSENSSHVFYLEATGDVNCYNNSYAGHAVRPVVYLKSNIYVTGGSGSINNPYQISL